MSDRVTGPSVFVEAVDAGGFSAAASRLNLSRSTVGKTIARLEAAARSAPVSSQHPNPKPHRGQAFYERCLRAIEEIRLGEAAVDSGRRDIAGRLRVSLPVLFGRRCAAPILADLARRHPKLELELNFNDRLVEMREDGFDLAVRMGPLPDETGLTVRRLAYHRNRVCAAPGYLVGEGDAPDPSLTAVVDWRFPAENASPIKIRPAARLRFDDLEAIADAAVAGMGLTWLPCWLIRERLLAGQLLRVLDDRPSLGFEIYAVWPQTPHLPLRVRRAIDELASNLPKLVD